MDINRPAARALQAAAEAGLVRRYGQVAGDARDRLAEELGLSQAKGVDPHSWLVLAQSAEAWREAGMSVFAGFPPGNSLIAYCLGISEIDPIAHGLLFETWYRNRTPEELGHLLAVPEAEIERVSQELCESWVGLAGRPRPRVRVRLNGHTTVWLRTTGCPGLGFPVDIDASPLPDRLGPRPDFDLIVNTPEVYASLAAGETLKRWLFKPSPSNSGLLPMRKKLGDWQEMAPPIAESAAMDYAARMRPRNLNDLAILIGLCQPRPVAAGALDKLIAGRNGGERDAMPHPAAESVLSETYGVLVFDEQAIRILSAVSKLPVQDAYRIWASEWSCGSEETYQRRMAGFRSWLREAGCEAEALAVYDWLAARRGHTSQKAICIRTAVLACAAAYAGVIA